MSPQSGRETSSNEDPARSQEKETQEAAATKKKVAAAETEERSIKNKEKNWQNRLDGIVEAVLCAEDSICGDDNTQENQMLAAGVVSEVKQCVEKARLVPGALGSSFLSNMKRTDIQVYVSHTEDDAKKIMTNGCQVMIWPTPDQVQAYQARRSQQQREEKKAANLKRKNDDKLAAAAKKKAKLAERQAAQEAEKKEKKKLPVKKRGKQPSKRKRVTTEKPSKKKKKKKEPGAAFSACFLSAV